MTEKEKYVLHCLQSRSYNLRRLAELTEAMTRLSYKITPSYSESGGHSSGKPQSKVENHVIKQERMEKAMAKCREELMMAEAVLNCKELSKQEYAAVECVALGGTMTTFAATWGIYNSYAYKIRDRAIKKALKHISRLETG